MKKHLIIILTLFLSITMFGQTNDTLSIRQDTYYCELVGTAKFLSKKVTVEIDFGENAKFFADNRYKDPATGKPAVFNSMIDALNFMGKQGWELANAYPIGDANSGYVYHWILKKKK